MPLIFPASCKMTPTFLLVALTAFIGLFTLVNSSSAQTWVLSTNAPNEDLGYRGMFGGWH